MPDEAADLAHLFEVLSTPSRIGIVKKLLDAPTEGMPAREVTDSVSVAQSTGSNHLKVLRKAGLIECERRRIDGVNWVYYWITPDYRTPLMSLFHTGSILAGRQPEECPVTIVYQTA